MVPVTRPTLDLWCVSELFFIIFSSSRATKLKKDQLSSSIFKRYRFFCFLGGFSTKIGKKITKKKKNPYLPTLIFLRQVTGTTPIFLFGLMSAVYENWKCYQIDLNGSLYVILQCHYKTWGPRGPKYWPAPGLSKKKKSLPTYPIFF